MTTIWQDNAAAFTSRPESHIDQERHAGVREALGLILEGKTGLALFKLTRSVERQNRIAGGGTHPIEPSCPCGGRCTHGGGQA